MKTRELLLWFLLIITMILCIGNTVFIGQNFDLIKIMTETQKYILELIDVKSGWMLL